jgi:WD40 repeat protein
LAFIHSFIHALIHSFMHSFIHSLIHSTDSSLPNDGYSLATASADGTIGVWHLPPPSPETESSEDESSPPRVPTMVRSLKGHSDEVLRVAWHPKVATTGLLASGGAEGAVMLWDHPTGAIQRRIQVGDEQIYSLAFAHDGE